MWKTPEEINEGLECCYSSVEPTMRCEQCPYYGSVVCKMHLHTDALDLIQQLEKDKDDLLEARELNDYLRDRVKQLEAERDAAVADLKEIVKRKGSCFACKRHKDGRCTDLDYKVICGFHEDKWEWRGVQKEE